MVVEWSTRYCLLCRRAFNGRTFLCRECSGLYRSVDIPADVYRQFYEALDREYPARSNTYGAYNEPAGLLRAIERLPREVRILEIGAGGGHLGGKLIGMGFTNVTLSDFTDTTLAAIRERLPQVQVVSADASSLPFEDASYEVVITTDVIEHLPAVEPHLREVRRVLSERGLYLVKTPNRLIADAYYRMRDMHDSYFWHPSMFTPRQLVEAFERHGFDTHFVPANRLTGAQVVKLPGPMALKSAARSIPIGWLPLVVQPHLEVVARKRSS
jgi:SAM-dependent methyltransferase